MFCTKRAYGSLLMLVCAAVLVACGGGGDSPFYGLASGPGGGNGDPGDDPPVSTTRVSVYYLAPLGKDWSDPNFFDVPHSHEVLQEYWDWSGEGYKSDPRILTFLEEENLKVLDAWDMGPIMSVKLPQGTTVDEAMERWPVEYPETINSVSLLYD